MARGEQYDPELLAAGDTRNVIDRYRYWRMEAIVADLDTQRHPFHVAIENWQHDMNIGSIVRSANAFLAGHRAHHRSPPLEQARGDGHRSLPARGAPRRRRDLRRLGCGGGPTDHRGRQRRGCRAVDRAELPQRCVLLFGQEGPGLSAEALAAASATSRSPSTARRARSTPAPRPRDHVRVVPEIRGLSAAGNPSTGGGCGRSVSADRGGRHGSRHTHPPFLWFVDRAQEAMEYYVSVFPNSSIDTA